jgi:hypothetical protein
MELRSLAPAAFAQSPRLNISVCKTKKITRKTRKKAKTKPNVKPELKLEVEHLEISKL